MGILFRRKWRISFGLYGQPLRMLSGLRVVFDIKKTSDDNPNMAKIDIYNLSPKSRAIIEKPNSVVILEVGYNDEEYSILYSGNITRVNHDKKEADYVTTLECGDGEIALREVYASKSFSGGTKVSSVINDLLKKLTEEGKLISRKLPTFIDEVYQQGFVAEGNVKDVLKDVLKKVNLSMSVQNGEIQIVERSKYTSNTAILLTHKTGLIGSAKKMKEGKISFQSLINTGIIPGRRVKIDSINIVGVFNVISANFKGDTHGDDWTVLGECLDASVIDYNAFTGD